MNYHLNIASKHLMTKLDIVRTCNSWSLTPNLSHCLSGHLRSVALSRVSC